jgi:4-hydroxy-tetrahydrodipicolinate reductase
MRKMHDARKKGIGKGSGAMKYAVIGTGKTGNAVLKLLPEKDIVAVCNTRNPVTLDKLRGVDVGVVFVPGVALDQVLPVLLASKMPMVVGTTGYPWPEDFDQTLKNLNVPWIIGQNFSLGLNVMRYYARRIMQSLEALKPGQMKLGITEKHHIHKLDAPSGTALYIAQSLGFPPNDIASIREGDAKGTHSVSFDWPHDRITLSHEALDRIAFAEGVLLACGHISRLTPGLHCFEKLADDRIEESQKG